MCHKVSSQADWLMTRPIKVAHVLNNAAFVEESSEGLFHQEPVYLPLSLFFHSRWRCSVLSSSYMTVKVLKTQITCLQKIGGGGGGGWGRLRNETLSCSVHVYWLANETKITCKNVSLSERGLGFMWEMANYRQVLSGDFAATHFIRRWLTHVIGLLERCLLGRAKPDSQEWQASTSAEPTKDACMLKDALSFSHTATSVWC